MKNVCFKWIIAFSFLSLFFACGSRDRYIDLEDEQWVECYRCGGTGKIIAECEDCDGYGRVRCGYCNGRGQGWECITCGGTGQEKCSYCDGHGVEYNYIFERYESCFQCSGRGCMECMMCWGKGYDDCNNCGGRGWEYCYECEGEGEVNATCPDCEGEGKVRD